MKIGITGLAGSGKSTVADHLVAEHGFTRMSFASPLKAMLRTLDPILEGSFSAVPERLSDIFGHYGDAEADVKASEYGVEYRRLLQVLGTDCIRAVDEDFWVRAALAQVTADRVVFDDVRFPNEAAAMDLLWNIRRPDLQTGTHVSEQHAGRMGEHHVIHNNGTPEQLRRFVDKLVGSANR